VRAVPTGRRIGSVDVHGFRVMVRMIRWPSVLGEGGALLGLRCRAGSHVVRGERVRARFGMAMPLLASRACMREGSAQAGEWPTGSVGSSHPLGIDDGG
jgi:hypothetical protein